MKLRHHALVVGPRYTGDSDYALQAPGTDAAGILTSPHARTSVSGKVGKEHGISANPPQ